VANDPQPLTWNGERAVLLVHGVGNAKQGDYDDLVRQLEAILGDEAASTAIYTFYYDQVNDWFSTKLQAQILFERLLNWLRVKLAGTAIAGSTDPAALSETIANFAGDVIWPVLIADARHAVRLALISQLERMVLDGKAAGVPARRQHLTIVAHSMGCFHVYEALHTIAQDSTHGLSPATWGVRFANVIFMASPVQLIRSVASDLGGIVPQRDTLHTVASPLAMPSEMSGANTITSSRNTVAIAGNLDPVSGFFFRSNPSWAYMNLPGQVSIVDPQRVVSVNGSEDVSLAALLSSSLRERAAPKVEPQNPHSWSEYMRRHEAEMREWIV
jgi:hypothetical protein